MHHMRTFRTRPAFRRRWPWLALCLLASAASIVGPAQAVSDLVTEGINTLLTVPDSVEDDGQAEGDSFVSNPLRDSASASSTTSGDASVTESAPQVSDHVFDDEDVSQELITEFAMEPPEPTSNTSSQTDPYSGFSGRAFAGISPSLGPSVSKSSNPSGGSDGSGGSNEGEGTGYGEGAGSGGSAGSSGGGSDLPEGAFTAGELAEMGFLTELAPKPSPESWLVEYDDEPESAPPPSFGDNPSNVLNSMPPESDDAPDSAGDEDVTGPGGTPSPDQFSDLTPASPNTPGDDEAAKSLDDFVQGLDEWPQGPNDPSQGANDWAEAFDELPADTHRDEVAAIPEPASLLLFVTGGAGLFLAKRRRHGS